MQSDVEGADVGITSRSALDSEALSFLHDFKENPGGWFLNWLSNYRKTTQYIAEALGENLPEKLFDILWKRAHNDISNAGPGVMKYDTVDAMRDEFVQVIRDIYQDGSPANYERIVERFEGWKTEGRITMVPRLLIARAFAGVHPRRYHTTVDARSQNQILDWCVQHTGFIAPRSSDWATRAQALVEHFDRADLFGEDFLSRNIFPWYVLLQLRKRNAPSGIPPGHTHRPASAFADLPAARRFIALRHNSVQDELYVQLVKEFGNDKVWTEYPTGTGGLADARALNADGQCYVYEIKIADTASLVVRQAMGQLLEYSYRSGGLEAVKLFAVGEPDLDDVTQRFIMRLRADFSVEIDYLQIKLPEDRSLYA